MSYDLDKISSELKSTYLKILKEHDTRSDNATITDLLDVLDILEDLVGHFQEKE